MKIFSSDLSYRLLFDTPADSLHDCNFRGANLSWANLRGMNLSWSTLIGANLSWANLGEADVSRANLIWANLSSANLNGANFGGSDLSWTNLSGCDLRGANLSDTSMIECNLRGANLAGAKLNRANLAGAVLTGANLSGVLMSEHEINTVVSERTILAAGDLIAWKRMPDEAVIKFLIPAGVKRVGGVVGRKCRADVGGGETFDPNPLIESDSGMTFFITRAEAANS